MAVVRLVPVKAKEASVLHPDASHIDVTWQYEGDERTMAHVCETSADGRSVISENNLPMP